MPTSFRVPCAWLWPLVLASLIALPAAAQDHAFGGPCARIFKDIGVPEFHGDTPVIVATGPARTAVCRPGYALLHNNATRIPDWVAEEITVEGIEGVAVRRDNFKADPELTEGARAELKDYSGSGFDRGHQAPAADYKSLQTLMDESFFLSNMAPQVGRCFNRGVWRVLEEQVRDWVRTRERLIVFTGPVYSDPPRTIADFKPEKPSALVAVPEAFFKIVYDPERGRVLAFLIPNEKLCKRDPKEFAVPIDEIEELTGIDFFSALRLRRQTVIESHRFSTWGW